MDTKLTLKLDNSIIEQAKTYGVPTFEWTKKVSPNVLTLQDGKRQKELQFRI